MAFAPPRRGSSPAPRSAAQAHASAPNSTPRNGVRTAHAAHAAPAPVPASRLWGDMSPVTPLRQPLGPHASPSFVLLGSGLGTPTVARRRAGEESGAQSEANAGQSAVSGGCGGCGGWAPEASEGPGGYGEATAALEAPSPKVAAWPHASVPPTARDRLVTLRAQACQGMAAQMEEREADPCRAREERLRRLGLAVAIVTGSEELYEDDGSDADAGGSAEAADDPAYAPAAPAAPAASRSACSAAAAWSPLQAAALGPAASVHPPATATAALAWPAGPARPPASSSRQPSVQPPAPAAPPWSQPVAAFSPSAIAASSPLPGFSDGRRVEDENLHGATPPSLPPAPWPPPPDAASVEQLELTPRSETSPSQEACRNVGGLTVEQQVPLLDETCEVLVRHLLNLDASPPPPDRGATGPCEMQSALNCEAAFEEASRRWESLDVSLLPPGREANGQCEMQSAPSGEVSYEEASRRWKSLDDAMPSRDRDAKAGREEANEYGNDGGGVAEQHAPTAVAGDDLLSRRLARLDAIRRGIAAVACPAVPAAEAPLERPPPMPRWPSAAVVAPPSSVTMASPAVVRRQNVGAVDRAPSRERSPARSETWQRSRDSLRERSRERSQERPRDLSQERSRPQRSSAPAPDFACEGIQLCTPHRRVGSPAPRAGSPVPSAAAQHAATAPTPPRPPVPPPPPAPATPQPPFSLELRAVGLQPRGRSCDKSTVDDADASVTFGASSRDAGQLQNRFSRLRVEAETPRYAPSASRAPLAPPPMRHQLASPAPFAPAPTQPPAPTVPTPSGPVPQASAPLESDWAREQAPSGRMHPPPQPPPPVPTLAQAVAAPARTRQPQAPQAQALTMQVPVLQVPSPQAPSMQRPLTPVMPATPVQAPPATPSQAPAIAPAQTLPETPAQVPLVTPAGAPRALAPHAQLRHATARPASTPPKQAPVPSAAPSLPTAMWGPAPTPPPAPPPAAPAPSPWPWPWTALAQTSGCPLSGLPSTPLTSSRERHSGAPSYAATRVSSRSGAMAPTSRQSTRHARIHELLARLGDISACPPDTARVEARQRRAYERHLRQASPSPTPTAPLIGAVVGASVRRSRSLMDLVELPGERPAPTAADLAPVPAGMLDRLLAQLPTTLAGASHGAGRDQSLSGDTSGGQDPCIICLEPLEPTDVVLVLPCIHRYHRDCIREWLRHARLCPLCKGPVFPETGADGY